MALDCECGIVASVRCRRCDRPACASHAAPPDHVCFWCRNELRAALRTYNDRYETARQRHLDRLLAKGDSLIDEKAATGPAVQIDGAEGLAVAGTRKVRSFGAGRIVLRASHDRGVDGWARLDNGQIVGGSLRWYEGSDPRLEIEIRVDTDKSKARKFFGRQPSTAVAVPRYTVNRQDLAKWIAADEAAHLASEDAGPRPT